MKLRWMIVWSYLYSDVHTNRLWGTSFFANHWCTRGPRAFYAYRHKREK